MKNMGAVYKIIKCVFCSASINRFSGISERPTMLVAKTFAPPIQNEILDPPLDPTLQRWWPQVSLNSPKLPLKIKHRFQ